MNVEDFVAADQPRTEVAQAKLKPSEVAQLDAAVETLRAQGYKITRSGLIRAFVNRGLAMYREELAAE